jgi:YVTN family beta-propeller protein
MVVDTQTGKLAWEIGGLQHAHGVAFNDQNNVGYISDGGAGTVVVFDRATRKTITAIQVGKNPDAILFEPTRKLVFVFNGASKNANVIDTDSNKVIATIPMPGKPEFAVTDGAGNIFVNIEDTSQILHIDAATLKVTNSWSLAPCIAPSGLAIDVAHRRLFSVCDNDKVAIVDSTSGKIVATPAIGAGADAVAYDGKHRLVFSSNGESGNLTILQQATPDRYTTFQTLPTMVGARTLALDPSNDNIYTVTAKLGPKPAATKAAPKPRPEIVPDTFVVLVVRR